MSWWYTVRCSQCEQDEDEYGCEPYDGGPFETKELAEDMAEEHDIAPYYVKVWEKED